MVGDQTRCEESFCRHDLNLLVEKVMLLPFATSNLKSTSCDIPVILMSMAIDMLSAWSVF